MGEKFHPDVTRFLNMTGRTQQSLADELGCSRSRVAQWCNGNADISRTDCGALIKLGFSIAELFGQEVEDYVVQHYAGQKLDISKMSEEECFQIVQKGLSGLMQKKNQPEGEEPSKQ